MDQNLVSTIIPVYNRSMLLKQAVQSVLAQTYRPIEIIIVDDGSTDDTMHTADAFALQYPDVIKVIHQTNKGPGLAREVGRLVAQGDFIQYLDSDDVLLPKKYEFQVEGLIQKPGCGVSYGKTRFYRINDVPSDIPWKRTGEKIEKMFPSFLQSRWWGTSTPLYRRTLTDQAGPWINLKNEEDWEYDCRIAGIGVQLHYVPEFVSEERDHGGARLSRDGADEQIKLKHRAIAHTLIFEHALRAGISENAPEIQYFARELFLLARQCGAAGLAKESEELFLLSKKASGNTQGKRWEFKVYEILAKIVGWQMIGKVACYSDRFRR